MNIQNTNFEKAQRKLFGAFSNSVIGPWKQRSLSLISLLVGYYIGSNSILYYLEKTGQRPIVVLVLVLLIELVVRLRSRISGDPFPIHWVLIDNIRIGAVYAFVLEAFKLGS